MLVYLVIFTPLPPRPVQPFDSLLWYITAFHLTGDIASTFFACTIVWITAIPLSPGPLPGYPLPVLFPSPLPHSPPLLLPGSLLTSPLPVLSPRLVQPHSLYSHLCYLLSWPKVYILYISTYFPSLLYDIEKLYAKDEIFYLIFLYVCL